MKHLIQPEAPYSFVADGLAIGGITAYGEPLEPFALAMNVAHEFHTVPVPDRIRGCPFLSLDLDDCDDIRPFVPRILRAVEYVRYVHRTGRQVLVTCRQGRNRSGIVVAGVPRATRELPRERRREDPDPQEERPDERGLREVVAPSAVVLGQVAPTIRLVVGSADARS